VALAHGEPPQAGDADDDAEAEAAQKAASFDTAGDKAQANFWRRVGEALQEMRGPRES